MKGWESKEWVEKATLISRSETAGTHFHDTFGGPLLFPLSIFSLPLFIIAITTTTLALHTSQYLLPLPFSILVLSLAKLTAGVHWGSKQEKWCHKESDFVFHRLLRAVSPSTLPYSFAHICASWQRKPWFSLFWCQQKVQTMQARVHVQESSCQSNPLTTFPSSLKPIANQHGCQPSSPQNASLCD